MCSQISATSQTSSKIKEKNSAEKGLELSVLF